MSECSREASIMKRLWHNGDCSAMGERREGIKPSVRTDASGSKDFVEVLRGIFSLICISLSPYLSKFKNFKKGH